jgi:NAD(P)-dependent dehydrogenase (short-subunit alcohol dehydrogenase family)
MPARKQSRVVVVTGASAGVGRATVRAFAGEGDHVGLIARDTEGLHVAAREAQELGGKGLAVPADVADADQVEKAAARIENELGPHVHVVVGKKNGSAMGGHLLEAHVRPTLELVLQDSGEQLKRTFDAESGLALIDLE